MRIDGSSVASAPVITSPQVAAPTKPAEGSQAEEALESPAEEAAEKAKRAPDQTGNVVNVQA